MNNRGTEQSSYLYLHVSHPHSFQEELSFDEKDDPAKNTKDIDVSVLVNLPKGESGLSVLCHMLTCTQAHDCVLTFLGPVKERKGGQDGW